MISRALVRPRAVDLIVAAAFVGAATIEAIARYHGQPARLAIGMAGALAWGCLALRRVRPLLTVAIAAGAGIAGALVQGWLAPGGSTNSGVAIIAMMVVSYSLGACGSRRELLLGAPLPVLTILITDLLQPADQSLARALPFAVVFVVLAPVVAGRLVRSRALAVEQLRAQAAELAAHRAEQVAAEVALDRLRLSEQFHERLLEGMQDLLDDVQRAQHSSHLGERVTAIEVAARDLLAETRQVVVSLVDGTADRPSAAPEPETSGTFPARTFPVRWRSAAQPWAALVAAALCAGLIVELHSLPLHAPLPVAVVACALLVLPLGLVWVSPLPMTGLLWVFAVLFDAFVASLATSTAAIGLVVAAPFTVAALTTRPRAIVGLAVFAIGELAVFGTETLGAALVISAAGWIAGAVLRERSRLVEELRRGAELLAVQRAEIAQREMVAERARLACDLHDTIGHSLTVVALQAGAARRLCGTDPNRAEQVLATLASVTAGGLAELRAGWAPLAAAPDLSSPDVDPFEALLEGARSAGLPLDVSVDDVLSRLDVEAAQAAYRVVQESLTNVLRHAPGAATTITARACGSVVELGVANATGSADTGPGSRRGLIGMLSRVTACGGRLEWGPCPDGGFAVRAWLPLAVVEAGSRIDA